MISQLRLAALLGLAAAAATSVAAQNPNEGPTTTGQVLSVEIEAGDTVSEEAEEFLVSACADLTPATAVNVVYVIDVSGSMVNPNPATGGNPYGNILPPETIGPEDDLNGDGLEGTTLDAAIAAVIQLNRSFDDLPDVEVGMVAFGAGGLSGDMSPAAGQTDFLTPPDLDASGNGVPDLEDVARSLQTVYIGDGVAGFELFTDNTTARFSYQTNYDAALAELNTILASQPEADDTIIFFITDGQPTTFTTGAGSPLQESVDAGYIVNCFGVGTGAVGLCDPGQPLEVISGSTGGTCVEVEDPGDLTGELPGGSSTDIAELSLLVNGEVVAMVSGPESEQLCIGPVDVIDFLMPGENLIQATATTDDGTSVTASVNVNQTMCMLLLGFDRAETPLGNGDVLLVVPQAVWSVTMENCPDLAIPDNPLLIGFHAYLQVVMYNEVAFPGDPLQLSNGVDVEVGGAWSHYGSVEDIALWLNQSPSVGGVIDPSFAIHGM